MPDFPSRTDLFNVFASEVLARAQARSTGRQITAGEIFTPGSDINLLGAGGSAMGEEVLRQLARSTKDLTLDGAVGAALDRYAFNKYGSAVPRKTAAAARVTLTLARPTGAFGAFSYPSGARVTTPGGIQFETLATAPFAGASVGPVTVNARAVNAGTAGNVAAGSITQKVTASADGSMTVVNTEPATGGDATEADALYRERIRAYPLSLSKGTAAALVRAALAVGGVRRATSLEELDAAGTVTGRVYLFVADVNGQANLALIADVRAAMAEARALGIPLIIVGGVPTFIGITYKVAFDASVDSVLAFDQLRSTTVARVNQLAPQETLQRSMLFEIARSINGAIVNADAVTAPAGDIVPTPLSGQVLRTSVDLVINS